MLQPTTDAHMGSKIGVNLLHCLFIYVYAYRAHLFLSFLSFSFGLVFNWLSNYFKISGFKDFKISF